MGYTPKHAAPAAPKKARKPQNRFRRVSATLAFLLTISAAVAFAAGLGRATVAGSGKGGTFSASWWFNGSSSATVTPIEGSIAGTATVTESPNRLTLAGSDLLPGESFEVSARVFALGRDGYLSGIELPGLPAGFEASIVTGCGAQVKAFTGSTSPGSADTTPVKFRITRTEASTGDVAWTLGQGAAVKVSTATVSPTSCTVYKAA